jgi:hypothetical protein
VDDERREALRRRYRALVDEELPAEAARRGWPIRRNHCFGRVLLDDAVGACWYDVLGRGPGAAYRRLDDDRLAHAVEQAERMLVEGEPAVRELDGRSLAWRGKPAKTAR